MKKIFLIFVLFFITLPVFANYAQIPESKKSFYKKDIEQAINIEVLSSKSKIRNICNNIRKEKDENIRRIAIEQGINSVILEFYIKIINITDNYIDIKKNIKNTDWHEDLQDIVFFYIKENNINSSKLTSFLKYAKKKQTNLEKKYKY